MRIAVALCTYNGARFIGEQLESLASQTRLPHEVVVCDDGSTDETRDLVSRFASHAPFNLRMIRNEVRLGVTGNFGRAISLCEGDIIFLCDQDDCWLPDKIATLTREFEADPNVGCVFSDALVTDAQLTPFGYTMWQSVKLTKQRLRRIAGADALSVLNRRYVVTGATMAFRSDLIKHILPIPAIWHHDAWIACVAAAVSRIVPVGRPLILYRQHGSNVIGGIRAGLLPRIKEAQVRSPAWFEMERERAARWMKKLTSLPAAGGRQRNLRQLTQRVHHLASRRDMCYEPLALRLLLVLRELATLRYFRFSEGLGAVFVDLFLRTRTRRASPQPVQTIEESK